MTDDRFDDREPKLAKGEPRISDGDAPVRPLAETEPVESAALDDAQGAVDAADDGVGAPEADAAPPDDDATPPEDGTIAKPAHFTAVREDKGWSINEVAGRLRMQVRQIEAIEAGRWDVLPGTAFVRAAIRSYARLLDRDPAPLLARVAQLDTGADLRSPHRTPVAIAPTSSFDETSGIGRWGLALLGLLAVIAIAFYFAPSAELRWPSQWFEGEDRGSLGDGLAGERATGPGAPGAVDAPSPDVARAPERTGPAAVGSPSDDAVAAAARAANELLANQPARREPADPAVARSPGDDGTQPQSSAGAAATSGAGGDAARPVDGSMVTPMASDGVAVASVASPADEAAPGPGADAAPDGNAGATAATASGAEDAQGGDARASAASATASTGMPARGDVSANSLMMAFDAECWVEVSDAQGKRLVYGLQKPRTSLSLEVRGPVSVLVGNADAVTMTRGGEPVDVTSQARDGVAKLRLQ